MPDDVADLRVLPLTRVAHCPGAMGVRSKFLDVNLRSPRHIEVISEKYLGAKSARLRFLREARAAASVNHPSVASTETNPLNQAAAAVGIASRSSAGVP